MSDSMELKILEEVSGHGKLFVAGQQLDAYYTLRKIQKTRRSQTPDRVDGGGESLPRIEGMIEAPDPSGLAGKGLTLRLADGRQVDGTLTEKIHGEIWLFKGSGDFY
jgi:hypothetical protein